jgi:hypothetical protein
MKSILLFAGTIILFSLGSCVSQKDFIIESDYSYLGRFNKYKTFDFVNIDKRDSSSHNPDLEKWIISRMESQGYSYSNRKPDIYVNYKIYFSDLKYRGYNQEDLNAYLNKEVSLASNDEFEDEVYLSDAELTELENAEAASRKREYDSRYYTMDSGTLLIILVDRRKHSAVWQGYASGVFALGADNLDRQLRRAAGVIFDKYKVVADGYLIND